MWLVFDALDDNVMTDYMTALRMWMVAAPQHRCHTTVKPSR